MTVQEMCKTLGVSPKVAEEAQRLMTQSGVNLNDEKSIIENIQKYSGKVKPILRLAKPVMGKYEQKIQQTTGYSISELLGAFDKVQGVSPSTPPTQYTPRTSNVDDIRKKYTR